MRFLILSNPTKQEAAQFSRQLTKHLIADGHTVLYEGNSSTTAPDAVILSGGDGTVLRHVELLKKLDVPILGINFGNFGFLTSCEPENAYAWIDRIISGTCRIEDRMLFAGEILHDTTRTSFCGLNEVVIHRGLLNRPLKFSLSINENPAGEFPADGIIVATPTGSTAYNLSAGGPVLLPESRNLVITPICPKGLLNSSIVIPDTDCVRITFEPPNEFEEGESPILTADGREKHFLSFRDEIRVCRASETLHICNDESPAFLKRLQRKIACSV